MVLNCPGTPFQVPTRRTAAWASGAPYRALATARIHTNAKRRRHIRPSPSRNQVFGASPPGTIHTLARPGATTAAGHSPSCLTTVAAPEHPRARLRRGPGQPSPVAPPTADPDRAAGERVGARARRQLLDRTGSARPLWWRLGGRGYVSSREGWHQKLDCGRVMA